MSPRTAFSAQTLAVLAALATEPSAWRHGYDLARETGLKSGTLYPILVRLAGTGVPGPAAILPGFAGDGPDSAVPALPLAG